MSVNSPPDALLLIAPDCSHCPAVLEALSGLLKAGRLGRLEIINVAAHPEAAQAVGTRSVPWTRIGDFELEGMRSAGELSEWARYASEGTGMTAYLAEMLDSHRLDGVIARVRSQPALLHDLVILLADPYATISVRIGIGAVFEEVAALGLLTGVLHELGALTQHENQQLRVDAAHYLGLSGDLNAAGYLLGMRATADLEAREIVDESLAMIGIEPPIDN